MMALSPAIRPFGVCVMLGMIFQAAAAMAVPATEEAPEIKPLPADLERIVARCRLLRGRRHPG